MSQPIRETLPRFTDRSFVMSCLTAVTLTVGALMLGAQLGPPAMMSVVTPIGHLCGLVFILAFVAWLRYGWSVHEWRLWTLIICFGAQLVLTVIDGGILALPTTIVRNIVCVGLIGADAIVLTLMVLMGWGTIHYPPSRPVLISAAPDIVWRD